MERPRIMTTMFQGLWKGAGDEPTNEIDDI